MAGKKKAHKIKKKKGWELLDVTNKGRFAPFENNFLGLEHFISLQEFDLYGVHFHLQSCSIQPNYTKKKKSPTGEFLFGEEEKNYCHGLPAIIFRTISGPPPYLNTKPTKSAKNKKKRGKKKKKMGKKKGPPFVTIPSNTSKFVLQLIHNSHCPARQGEVCHHPKVPSYQWVAVVVVERTAVVQSLLRPFQRSSSTVPTTWRKSETNSNQAETQHRLPFELAK
jgi:hypothetical protein